MQYASFKQNHILLHTCNFLLKNDLKILLRFLLTSFIKNRIWHYNFGTIIFLIRLLQSLLYEMLIKLISPDKKRLSFQVLPVVVFFYTVTSVLYYLGVMQVIVKKMGMFLSFCLGTSPAESLNAAGNIFVGMVQLQFFILSRKANPSPSDVHTEKNLICWHSATKIPYPHF